MLFGLDISKWEFLFDILSVCSILIIGSAVAQVILFFLIRFSKKDLYRSSRRLNLLILICSIISLFMTLIIVTLLGEFIADTFRQSLSRNSYRFYVQFFLFLAGYLAPLLLLVRKLREDLNTSLIISLLIISCLALDIFVSQ